MLEKIAQHKQSPTEEYWWEKFQGLNISERVALVKKSRIFALLLKHITPDDRVVEGGCGMGKLAIALKESGVDILGVDYSGRLIKKIRESRPDVAHCFATMDCRKLSYKDKSFTVYISPGVIEHFGDDDQNKILSEARRVLTDDGKLLCIVPFINVLSTVRAPLLRRKEFHRKQGGVPFYQFRYSRKGLRGLLSQNGFRVVKTELLGLHDTKLLGRRVFPKWLQNNKLLLEVFGTTLVAVCKKK